MKDIINSYEKVENPKFKTINFLNDKITSLSTKIDSLTYKKISLRDTVEKDINGRTGLLDELSIMVKILKKSYEDESYVAIGFYLLWLFFFFGLEIFILASSFGERKSEYHMILEHQLLIKEKKLKGLSN